MADFDHFFVIFRRKWKVVAMKSGVMTMDIGPQLSKYWKYIDILIPSLTIG